MNLFKLMATISLDDKAYNKSLTSSEKNTKSFSEKVNGFGSKIGKLGGVLKTVAVGGFGVYMTSAVKAATALSETQKKTNVIFGNMTKDVQSWSAENERTFGLGAGTIEGFVGKIGDLSQGLGMAKDKSLDFSKGAVELGVQLSNWAGVGADEAMTDLQSALMGSHRAMEKYGVKLNETVLNEYTRKSGLGETFNKLSEVEKAQVRYDAILGSSKNAIDNWNDGNRSMAFRIQEVKEQLGNVSENIGMLLLPIVEKLAKKLGDFTADLAKFSAKASEVFNIFKENIELGISPMESLYGAMYNTFGQEVADKVDLVAKAVWGLTIAFLAVKGVMITNAIIGVVGGFISMIAPIVSAVKMVKSFSGAMAILNMVLMMNPIGLIVGLIGLLAGGFIYLMTTNTEFKDNVLATWDFIKQKAEDVWGSIKTFFTETIPNAIQSMMEWFSQLPTRISEWFTQAKETISNWASETWQKAVEAGSNFINSIIEWFQQLPYNIGFFIGESMAKLAIWATETWEKAKEMGSNFISAVVEWFQQLPTRISEFITESLNKVKTWSSEMWNKAKEMGSNFINGAIDWFKQLPGKISQWLRNTIDKVRTWVQDMKNKAKEAASEFTKWLIDGIKGLPNKFANIGSDIIKGVWNGILNMKEWLMSKVSNFFSGMLDGVKSVFGIHSPSRVFRDEVGKWIPAGVAVGIEGGMPDLEKTLNTEMGGLVDIAEPTGFTLMNNRNDEIIGLLKQLVAKDTVLEMEGREVARSIAPYQNELQEYSRLVTI